MPSYNNAATLGDVLQRTCAIGLPTYVVNDGSTDATAALLKEITESEQSICAVRVVTHVKNCGKAAALRSGFRAAFDDGFTHAVTIDSDGQLDPADIPAVLSVAAASPDALVVGTRDDRAADYPKASRIGRRISNFAIRLECGAKALDSQCGLRVYPLRMILVIDARAGRFGYEAEIITKFVWAGGRIVNTPVTCRYFSHPQRISHFRRWRDTLQGIALHARLLLRALWPAPHSKQFQSQGADEGSRSFWREMGRWINPRTLWQQLRSDGAGRLNIAAGFGLGVFIANLPLYGLQTLLGLYAARRWHLHAIPVVAGSNLSIPPIAPFLIIAAIYTGHMILFGSPPSAGDLELTPAGLARAGMGILTAWVVGGIVLGLALGLAAFGIVYSILGPLSPKENEAELQCEVVDAPADHSLLPD